MQSHARRAVFLLLTLLLSAAAAYGCGTILAISPDEAPAATSEGGDATSPPSTDAGSGDASQDACTDDTCVAPMDGGCDAATSCATGQCGTISNGCGGVVVCAGCTGDSYCDVDASVCRTCSAFETGCPSSSTSTCPTIPAGGNRVICAAPPANPACVYCPNPSTGKGLFYCCP